MAVPIQHEVAPIEISPVSGYVSGRDIWREAGTRKIADSDLRKQYENYKALVDRANEVFGDDLTAARWLSMPSIDLENKVPLQLAQSFNYDANQMYDVFEPIFLRIEHGIYS